MTGCGAAARSCIEKARGLMINLTVRNGYIVGHSLLSFLEIVFVSG